MKERTAIVYKNGIPAGEFIESPDGFVFEYFEDYQGNGISLTIPRKQTVWKWDSFPAFFDGVLPEGILLEALLKNQKIDGNDYFGQLLAVGEDLVGDITVLQKEDR